MSKNSSFKGGPAMIFHEINENESLEVRTLMQEEINEQIKSFITLFTRELENLTPLLQGMSIASHLNFYPRADTNASYSVHGYQPDTFFTGSMRFFVQFLREIKIFLLFTSVECWIQMGCKRSRLAISLLILLAIRSVFAFNLIVPKCK